MSESFAPLNEQAANGLTKLEIEMLDFERTWWRYAGVKESSIKELFNLTPPAYYQLLNNLIDRNEALLAEPILVKRLRRLRDSRTAQRSSSKLGFSLYLSTAIPRPALIWRIGNKSSRFTLSTLGV